MQLTAYLSALTNSTYALNEVRADDLSKFSNLTKLLQLVDKHILAYSGAGSFGGGDPRFGPPGRRRGPPGGRIGAGASEWDRFH